MILWLKLLWWRWRYRKASPLRAIVHYPGPLPDEMLVEAGRPFNELFHKERT